MFCLVNEGFLDTADCVNAYSDALIEVLKRVLVVMVNFLTSTFPMEMMNIRHIIAVSRDTSPPTEIDCQTTLYIKSSSSSSSLSRTAVPSPSWRCQGLFSFAH